MGIIATRSLDKQVTGLKDLVAEHEERIRNGMQAYALLNKLQGGDRSATTLEQFNAVKGDLGYGLLLKSYTANITDATEEQIRAAAKGEHPRCGASILRLPHHGWGRGSDAVADRHCLL